VQQNSDLLLGFASTVIPVIGLRRDPWPYFYSFQGHLCILKSGFLFEERSGWSFCEYFEQSSNLLLAFASILSSGLSKKERRTCNASE
jgi:hypothetical protein